MHTISAEELLKAYNGKYKYVTMDKGGDVTLWKNKPSYDDGTWVPCARRFYLGKIAITEFQNQPWQECIYKAKPSEEDWIGCIGWFWDYDCKYISKILGILEKIDSNDTEPYKKQGGWYFRHFRPVRPAEIKFFNDDTSEE